MDRNNSGGKNFARARLRAGMVYPGLAALLVFVSESTASAGSFVNFETAPVHPIALNPSHTRLAVCNLPDNRLEVFDITGPQIKATASIPVGLDPVSVRFRTDDEAWVVNQISDSISLVDLRNSRVVATLATGDAPADVIFAGTPARAFVSCAGANSVQVFEIESLAKVNVIPIAGDRPKAMAASADGSKIYVAIFESGNGSTIISPGVDAGFPRPSPVDFPFGPHGGQNPPPNSGTNFSPAINPLLPATNPPPRGGLIVKKNAAGRWMDDNRGDWTEFIGGTNSAFTGRPAGWDLPDHDVAVMDTTTLAVSYLSGLMNICMDLAVNPASSRLAVVGTDARNEIRFEPVLQSQFTRVELALVDPTSAAKTILDLNPHLDYRTPLVPETERAKSLGDPRGIVWNAAGTRGYVTGMGSGNLAIIDSTGARAGKQTAIVLADGACGLALDEPRHRLFVLNRFAATVSIVDTDAEVVIGALALFDPTPAAIKAGRKHFYDTQKSSGLGQASCASCHVDARFDRLAWDLGDPAGESVSAAETNRNYARFVASTNDFHPLKGPMVTQTLQDIIGHEPFHWRGDRDGLEQFNGTFTNLQGAASALTTNEMKEFKDFLATIHFPPNPFRELDNSLPVNLPLPGHVSLGRGNSKPGARLPNGNARNGLARFSIGGQTGCIHCHSLPAGLGSDKEWTGTRWKEIPPGTNGEHHVALVPLRRAANLPFKIPSLRNLYDKLGADFGAATSQSGFGFTHDGGVDSLVRFVQDVFDFRDDRDTADIVAFLLAFTGSDLPRGSFTDPDRPPGAVSQDVPAAVGKQITITNAPPPTLLTNLFALALNATSRVDLIVHGAPVGEARGWLVDRATKQFQSDRRHETFSWDELLATAAPNNPLTFTAVPRGSGQRLGLDRDEDGHFDRDELDAGSDPNDAASIPIELRVTELLVSPATISISWQTMPAKTYRLQFKDRLEEPVWRDVAGDVIADGISARKIDAREFGALRFYRVRRID